MLDVYVIATSWSPSLFHCDKTRLKVLIRGCCGHAMVCLWGCQRTKLQTDRFGRVLPCSALLCTALLSFVFDPVIVSLPALFFNFGSVSHNTTPHTLTFRLLNCWYHWLTQSTSAASRPSRRVLTHQRVWNDVRELDFGHGEHENLLCTLLTSSSAPPASHHHLLYLSLSTTGLLWTPLQERCDSRNIKKMLLMRLQTFVVAAVNYHLSDDSPTNQRSAVTFAYHSAHLTHLDRG